MKYGDYFTIECPADYSKHNKVEAIKAIRMLTMIGLKEAKDVTERPGKQTLQLRTPSVTPSDSYINENLRLLRVNGIHVGGVKQQLLQELRDLATKALAEHEDELANDILQLVLAEKLRGDK